MHDPRLGAAFRAVRLRRGWRQSDVAARARVSRTVVSRIEAGEIGRMQLDLIESVASSLEISIRIVARWRGGELERLLSARHSALQDRISWYLSTVPGWTSLPEVSFAIRGERGAIDIFAWHARTRSLLVIEVKTEIVDVSEMLGTLDRKRRLAWQIAKERGWAPATVSVWLAIADTSRNRRRAVSHRAIFASALPSGGWDLRRWLREPRGAIAALSFLPDALPEDLRRRWTGRRRVRGPGAAPARVRSGTATTAESASDVPATT